MTTLTCQVFRFTLGATTRKDWERSVMSCQFSDSFRSVLDPIHNTPWTSGRWEGYFMQGGARHSQTLELAFAQGRMSGTGDDEIGKFLIFGEYDEDQNTGAWLKQYLGKHQVYYGGEMSNGRIRGRWFIYNGYQSDRFELWRT
jgi:hypothetical protein